jgi:hypothetical protein
MLHYTYIACLVTLLNFLIIFSEERNILHTIKRRKAKCIGHILCRNCLLKHIIDGNTEGRIEVMGRQGRRCKQLLADLKETRGCWKLKEEALDHMLRRTHFG